MTDLQTRLANIIHSYKILAHQDSEALDLAPDLEDLEGLDYDGGDIEYFTDSALWFIVEDES